MLGYQLKFHNGNAKLDKGIFTFSLPSGWSCPFADACLSKVVNGKVQDGPNTEYRCFSASQESLFKNVHAARQHNFDLLKPIQNDVSAMVELIDASLPKFGYYFRLHVGGDFFNHNYFLAWLKIAALHPHQIFYAYTKSLPYWIAEKVKGSPIWSVSRKVPNFRLTASYGGRKDELIKLHNLRYARVVYSFEEATQLGLELDHDDSHAYGTGKSFGLLLHGIQPAKTPAAIALANLKRDGYTGYGPKSKKFPLDVLR